jgi:hypothetical protein
MIFYFYTNQTFLVRRPTSLRLPLQIELPGVDFEHIKGPDILKFSKFCTFKVFAISSLLLYSLIFVGKPWRIVHLGLQSYNL